MLQGTRMSRVGTLTTLAVFFAAACQSSSATSPGDAGNVGEAAVTSTGDATPEVQPASCTVPSDCTDFPSGPAIACCIGRLCMYGLSAGTDSCFDASAQIILASSYDQSCGKDSDCVAIEEGDFLSARGEQRLHERRDEQDRARAVPGRPREHDGRRVLRPRGLPRGVRSVLSKRRVRRQRAVLERGGARCTGRCSEHERYGRRRRERRRARQRSERHRGGIATAVDALLRHQQHRHEPSRCYGSLRVNRVEH